MFRRSGLRDWEDSFTPGQVGWMWYCCLSGHTSEIGMREWPDPTNEEWRKALLLPLLPLLLLRRTGSDCSLRVAVERAALRSCVSLLWPQAAIFYQIKIHSVLFLSPNKNSSPSLPVTARLFNRLCLVEP